MLANLSGKKTLITGTGVGIGRGIAQVLAAQGSDVAITDLNTEWAAETAETIRGINTLVMGLDVTSPQSVHAVVDRVLSEWGHIDILVNNAGVAFAPGFQGEEREVDWDFTFAVNVKGVVNCCTAVIPHLKEWQYGKIVNIASMAGHSARRVGGAYGTSKAAVLRYTKGLAVELGRYKINVNAVCPGAVWTPLQERGSSLRRAANPGLADRDDYELFVETYKPLMPLGRPQTPEDVGKVVAFLVSDDAANITGQCIHVDGGAIITD